MVSVAITHLYRCNAKMATDNTNEWARLCVNKTLLTKIGRGPAGSTMVCEFYVSLCIFVVIRRAIPFYSFS